MPFSSTRMMKGRFTALSMLLVLFSLTDTGTVSALRLKSRAESSNPAGWPEDQPAPVRVKLRPMKGSTLHFGHIEVGSPPQLQRALFDTASFEAVVQNKDACLPIQCPNAGFSVKKSRTFRQKIPDFGDENFGAMETMVYGPGNILSFSGTDTVRVTDDVSEQPTIVVGRNVPVKTVVEHSIPDFLHKGSEFNALIGLGPGSPERIKRKLNHKLGLRRFSVCLKQDPKDGGVLILDDQDRSQDPSFAEMDSMGDTYWEPEIGNLRARTETPDVDNSAVSCVDGGCKAILDTGAATFALTKGLYAEIEKALEHVQDCSEIHKLPRLEFSMGGTQHVLPPEAYVADAGLSVNKGQWPGLRFRPIPKGKASGGGHCVLLFTNAPVLEGDLFEPDKTLTLGAPFFRYYYTNFDISLDPERRVIYTAPAAPDCSGPHPEKEPAWMRSGPREQPPALQQVDLTSIMQHPRAGTKASEGGGEVRAGQDRKKPKDDDQDAPPKKPKVFSISDSMSELWRETFNTKTPEQKQTEERIKAAKEGLLQDGRDILKRGVPGR